MRARGSIIMKGISIAGRLTNYLWVASFISVIVVFFGLFYYLETEKKERYFNQLYFRQLEEISRGFETNLVRLRSFTRKTQNFISETFDENIARLEDEKVDIREPVSKPGADSNKPTTEPNNDIYVPQVMSPYKELIEAQFELDNYVADLTTTDLAGLIREDALEIYGEFEEDLVKLFTPEFVEYLACGGREVDSRIVDDGLYDKYCLALNTIIDVLESLPAYAEMDFDEVNAESIKKAVQKIENLKSIQKKASGVSVDSYGDALNNSSDVIDLLGKLSAQEAGNAISIIPFRDF